MRRPIAGLAVAAILSLAACSAARPAALPTGAAPATRSVPEATAPAPDPSGPPAASGAPAPGPAPVGGGPYLFPIGGTFNYGRSHHDYPATDIISPCGSVVRAVTDGTVLEVSRIDRYDAKHPLGQYKGGLSVSILGTDGVRYYGSHLSRVDTGIEAGRAVRAGTQLGLVGRTGDASVCHLHFGISPPCLGAGDWWTRRGAVWPWPYLDAWQAGRQLSPVAEVAAWRTAPGCPTAPPPGLR